MRHKALTSSAGYLASKARRPWVARELHPLPRALSSFHATLNAFDCPLRAGPEETVGGKLPRDAVMLGRRARTSERHRPERHRRLGRGLVQSRRDYRLTELIIPNRTAEDSQIYDTCSLIFEIRCVPMRAPTSLFPRLIEPRVIEALQDTPVVLIAGPRQAGKTTLVRQWADQGRRYLTLDDELTQLAAKEDPVGLIRNLDRAVIDEIQRAPQLLLAIKKAVDEDRRPGRFLLTGLANLMTLPTVADSLAGRMETLILLPLSQSEIRGAKGNWLDSAFAGNLPQAPVRTVKKMLGEALVEAVLRGGYPEAVSRATPRRRTAWARQYLDAIIQRDVHDVAGIERLDQLPRFLRALAQVSGQMCNYTQLGAQVGLDHKTAARYIGVFEQMYLLRRVEVWARNRLNRVVKTPKLQFLDSGLLSTMLDLTPAVAQQDRSRFGHVLETFVYGELLKHATTTESDYQLHYYRDHDQYEVDVVVENSSGQLVGVEIKAAATVTQSDLRGLKRLAGIAENKFKLGVVLYDGTETVPLGQRLWAAPIAGLWAQ